MSDNTVVTENTITNIVEVTSAGPAGPPGGALTIQDQGVSEGLLTDKLNFAGSTVSVNNDTVNEIATVTINAANPGANSNITSLSGITGGISSADYLQFDTAAGATGAVGRMLWNDTDGTLEFQMKGGNVTLQVGQEEVVRVTNQYGSTISDGQAVYITGSTGNHLNVTLAQANSEVNSSKTLAVVTESIANNGTGFATTSGLVRNLNTSALTEGAAIWLSPTVPGGLTSTKPVAPNHAVLIGWCVKQHATVGVIYVHIANGYELEELHNVLITSVTNNQVLRYDSATGLWKNATISPTVTLAGAVTGSGTLTDLGNVTITTTATSDPTLTLSGDASGSATFTNLGDATLTVTVADNSHDHTIANVTGLQTALDLKAPLASPTFTGSVTLPATTAIGTVSATEIGYLDGVTSAIQTQIDTKLASASYTAADVLTKIKTVDGSGSGLDADLLDGQDSAYYTAINARLGYTAENAANKGVAGGYASLDGSGTVPTSQLPAAVLGAVKYQGTWNASTNSPALTSSVGTQGYYYVVSVAGSTNLNGITDWVVGDWAIYNGSTWQKIDNTDAVTSVAGRTGAVTLSASDVSGLATVATSGAISDTTGTLAVGRGGTGATSLTSGYLVKGNGTSAASASVVYDDGTNVGIGTSSPVSKLHVSRYAGIGATIDRVGDFGPSLQLIRNGVAGSAALGLATDSTLGVYTDNTERMRITSTGAVGVGTSSPSDFGVNFKAITVVGSIGGIFEARGASSSVVRLQADTAYGMVDMTSNHPLLFRTNSIERVRITNTGDVGIGTATPAAKLDVNGQLNVPDQLAYDFTTSVLPDIAPTLNLNFVGANAVDPRITFTRSTTATYYDSDTTALAEQNLLTYSQELQISNGNVDWENSSSALAITANSVAAPDGTTTADTLAQTAVTASFVNQQRKTLLANTTYAFSVYVQNVDINYVALALFGAADNAAYAEFNLTTGALSRSGANGTGWSVVSTSIQSAGGSWYRIYAVITTGSTVSTPRQRIMLTDGTTAFSTSGTVTFAGTSKSAYFWGAQLEQRSTATAYNVTTASPITNYIPQLMTAAINQPRLDFDPITRAPKGLLIEEARTNLSIYTQQFDNAAWGKDGSSITANAAVSPDGTLNADLWVPTTSGAIGTVRLLAAITVSNATAYTASVYVKSFGRRWVYMSAPDAASLAYNCWFDLQNGVVGTKGASVTSATITSVGNGWYRITATSTSTNVTNYMFISSTDADNSTTVTANGWSGLFVYGAQLEAGSFATSYIPTVATSVQRTADVATMTGTNFSPWYNQSEGTFIFEGSIPAAADNSAGNYYFAVGDGTTSNQIAVLDTNGTRAQIIAGGSVSFDDTVGAEPTGTIKTALAYSSSSTILCVNGTLGNLDTSVVVPLVNRLSLGVRTDLSNGTTANGYIRSLRFYPVRFANAIIQGATA